MPAVDGQLVKCEVCERETFVAASNKAATCRLEIGPVDAWKARYVCLECVKRIVEWRNRNPAAF